MLVPFVVIPAMFCSPCAALRGQHDFSGHRELANINNVNQNVDGGRVVIVSRWSIVT